jgi:hypothetical protein
MALKNSSTGECRERASEFVPSLFAE